MKRETMGPVVAMVGLLCLAIAAAWSSWVVVTDGSYRGVELSSIGLTAHGLHTWAAILGNAVVWLVVIAGLLTLPAVGTRAFALCWLLLVMAVAILVAEVGFELLAPKGAVGAAFPLGLAGAILLGAGAALASDPAARRKGWTERDVDDDGKRHGRQRIYDGGGQLVRIETWEHGERTAVVEYDERGKPRPAAPEAAGPDEPA